jgi:hypothetical protein
MTENGYKSAMNVVWQTHRDIENHKLHGIHRDVIKVPWRVEDMILKVWTYVKGEILGTL